MSRFARARAALLPVVPGVPPDALLQALADGGTALEQVVLNQALAPLWYARTQAPVFREHRRGAAVAYLKQTQAVQEIDRLFDRAGVCYAIIKGVATRELTYALHPEVRVCSDIDVLVAPDQRRLAVEVLTERGYRLRVDPQTASHEVGLSNAAADVDLHWDILRPGRVPEGTASRMLDRRVRQRDMWMLADSDALAVMLVHGAVSKHVSTTGLGLHRVADLALWWQLRQPDWPVVFERLTDCGLCTAAWVVLRWVQFLVPAADLESRLLAPMASLEPGPLRAHYLNAWLASDLSDRLTNWHLLRLVGFSALLHDRPSAAWRALRGWRRARRTGWM